MILAGRQGPVHLLEVERGVEGAAQPHVLEQRPAQVEGPALHPARTQHRKLFLEHPPVIDRGEVVGDRPFLGAALGIPVELVGLEGLAAYDVVAEEFVAKFVEIILADAAGQILAPVILDPFEHQRPAGDEFLDAIGPGPQRRLQRGRGYVALAALRVGASPPVLREHVELARDQRKLAIAGAVEEELDVVIADLLGLDDVLVVEARSRAAGLLRVERKDHVFRGHRLAVVPARRRTQAVDRHRRNHRDRRRVRPACRNSCPARRGPSHQRLIDPADAGRDRALQPGDHDVEAVIRAKFEQAGDAALGRIGIDVVEALEVGGILDVAEGGNAVAPCQPVRRGLRQRGRGNAEIKTQRRSQRGCGGALQEVSSGDCQMRKSCCVRRLASTQYKARVRPITLLFPHDINMGTQRVRPNVPITTTRSLRKRPGNAWPSCRAQTHGGLAKYYFAAVGSGSGLSDTEFR